MQINVMFFGQLRDLAAVRESVVAIKGATLGDLMENLYKEYGAEFHKAAEGIKGLRILINGREYRLLGCMQAPLKDGDTVVLLPPIAGG
jgi:MoaD family protein